MTKYAVKTSVTVDRSKAEIESMLTRYGATRFASGWEAESAVILFEYNARRVKFELPFPEKTADRFYRAADGRHRLAPGKRADALALKLWEQECRSRWRALALVIKAKLEAVESGITTFEDEFLAHIVVRNGQTVGEWLGGKLGELGGKLPPLLGMGGT